MEASVLEMICRHTYDTWAGLPVDRSPYGLSNGESLGASYVPDGAAPGSGALDLGTDPAHRIHIPASRAWTDLGAIRVEMTVRLGGSSDSTGRTLIDGDGSFLFDFVSTPSAFGGTIHYSTTFYLRILDPDLDRGWVDVWTSPAAFLNRWVTVGFSYDGVHTAQITVDGAVRATMELSSPLRPVGPRGVSIGAPWSGPISNRPLLIDELTVWRRDPDYIHRNFKTRPLPAGVGDCWGRTLGAIRTRWAADPQQADDDRRRVREIERAIRRRIAASGDAATHQQLHERYLALWAAGALDSDDMEALFRDLATWWRDHGGEIWQDPDILGAIDGLRPGFEGLIGLDCDPELEPFMRRIRAGVGS